MYPVLELLSEYRGFRYRQWRRNRHAHGELTWQRDCIEEQLADADLAERLFQSLDDVERELVRLKYYEGRRNVEIAEELGINASTVSTKLARALQKMRSAARL